MESEQRITMEAWTGLTHFGTTAQIFFWKIALGFYTWI